MPSDAERHFFAGNDHLSACDFAAAEACYLDAVALDPLLAEGYANLAWVMGEIGATARAEAYYRRALGLSSRNYELRLNYGAFLAKLERYEAAERVYGQAIELDPARAAAWSNLGVLYVQMGRLAAAEECCRVSLSLDPQYDKACVNLAYLCLRDGRFEEGFEHYERRPWRRSLDPGTDCPCWAGEALVSKSLLVVHEGGFGDAIQFSRYASLAKRAGARRVGLQCPPELQTLLRTLDGVDVVGALDELRADRWDLWTPLMSLPHRFATTLRDIPAALPYLRCESAAIEAWRQRLPRAARLVGLAWRGNGGFENDAQRSIAAPEALQVLRCAGVRFVALHPDASEAELRRTGLDIVPAGDWIDSFADTAALVATLDLVISVDTAVAHLAGAIGTACWLLLPYRMPDWRWLTGRRDSPWYPGVMRLYRQEADAAWSPVLARLAGDLARDTAGCGPGAAIGAGRPPCGPG